MVDIFLLIRISKIYTTPLYLIENWIRLDQCLWIEVFMWGILILIGRLLWHLVKYWGPSNSGRVLPPEELISQILAKVSQEKSENISIEKNWFDRSIRTNLWSLHCSFLKEQSLFFRWSHLNHACTLTLIWCWSIQPMCSLQVLEVFQDAMHHDLQDHLTTLSCKSLCTCISAESQPNRVPCKWHMSLYCFAICPERMRWGLLTRHYKTSTDRQSSKILGPRKPKVWDFLRMYS